MARPLSPSRPPSICGVDRADILQLYKWVELLTQFTRKTSGVYSTTAAYTVGSEIYWVRADATAGAITITLPPVGVTGRPIGVIKIDASGNAVTIDGDGSETINGSATQSLAAQYDTIEVIDNGTSWDVKYQT